MLLTCLVLLLFCTERAFALTCLKCDGISQPRHCRQVVDCDAMSHCFTEQTLNSFGETVYNLGCLQTMECSRQRHNSSLSCVECCTSNLCNNQGCGQPDYPLYRGPICYACSSYKDPSRCHDIDFCAMGEVCSLSGRLEFSELVYSSACTTKQNCGDILAPIGVGRRDAARAQKRSHEQHACDTCCTSDLCNKNCSAVSIVHPTTITPIATGLADCKAILDAGLSRGDGLYTINVEFHTFQVFCDMTTDGGGWTVFQYRYDGSVDFYRNFSQYEDGFGKYPGEFWQGLRFLNIMTSSKPYQLRVDLTAANGTTGYGLYSTFTVGTPELYRLQTAGFSGTIGDKMQRQNGEGFTTFDKDQASSSWGSSNCAESFHGAWWYESCYDSNLNGPFKPNSSGEGLANVWGNWPKPAQFYHGLQGSKMSIRPV